MSNGVEGSHPSTPFFVMDAPKYGVLARLFGVPPIGEMDVAHDFNEGAGQQLSSREALRGPRDFGPEKVGRTTPPLDSALQGLQVEVQELIDAVAGLEKRLSPVCSPQGDDPNVVGDEKPRKESSFVTESVRNASQRIRTQHAILRRIFRTLDI